MKGEDFFLMSNCRFCNFKPQQAFHNRPWDIKTITFSDGCRKSSSKPVAYKTSSVWTGVVTTLIKDLFLCLLTRFLAAKALKRDVRDNVQSYCVYYLNIVYAH